jgi:AraC-like DNA-binding protein
MAMRHDMDAILLRIDCLLYADPQITLQGVARAIGTDRHNIEHAVRERRGFTFRELKKQVRVKRALLLIEEQPRIYIKEIAAKVGLTPNHLSRLIRSVTGCCATKLRCHK